jgi:hypothetical protein
MNQMKQMKQNKFDPVPSLFECKTCEYKTCRKSQYDRHLLTSKHQNETNETILEQTENQELKKYVCVCSKECNSRSTLWRHKKNCKHPQPLLKDDQIDISTLDMNLIMQLLKQNDDFKSLMVEQNNKMMETFQETIQEVCKNNTTNINNNMVNSNNKTFNLQVFLNEQCKDAMNIMEFVDTIKLDLEDAESVRKLGYVNGISNIIIKHLKALDVHMRPVHCTDLKRETVYVKYQDVWEKEGDDNKLMRKAIKHVAVKNYNAADIFKELHPDCMNWDSKHGDHFALLRIEALGGKGNINIYDSHTKIIKKIAKEITIDKTTT